MNRMSIFHSLPHVLLVAVLAISPHVNAHDQGGSSDGVGSQWEKGPAKIPDLPVIDQNGNGYKFYTDLVKGKTVAINFIFTSCATVCPPLTATFRNVQKQLGERVGHEVALISISVDSANDTPEHLKQFAAKFDAGPGWTFLTGRKSEIDQLLKALGAFAGNRNDHTPMILIGNETAGRWTRSYGLADATQLVRIINEAMPKRVGDEAKAAKDQTALQSGALIKVGSPTDGNDGNNSLAVPRNSLDQKMLAANAAKYFTNLPLVTHENKPVRFYDDLIKGRIVMINVMFATCTSICSPMTKNLAKVQEYLGDDVGRNTSIISISADPEHDTPAVLKQFADDHGAKSGWYFVTGKKENIDWVLYKLGSYVEDKMAHSSVLIIGNDATGEWMKVLALAKPAEIAEAVRKLAGPKKS